MASLTKGAISSGAIHQSVRAARGKVNSRRPYIEYNVRGRDGSNAHIYMYITSNKILLDTYQCISIHV